MPRLLPRPVRLLAELGRLAQALRRRCARLVAAGLAADEVATAEGLEVGRVEALLGEEAFGRLARGYRVLASRPPAERRDELIRLAQFLIDEAIGFGHVRVGFFVVREKLRGRDAAETVADRLLAQWERAAEPLPARPAAPEAADAPPRRAHLPAHPADRMAQRGCRDLTEALLAEVRVRGEAVFRAVRSAPAAVRHTPGHRRLVARLLTGVAAVTPDVAWPPKLAQAP